VRIGIGTEERVRAVSVVVSRHGGGDAVGILKRKMAASTRAMQCAELAMQTM
jgi:hypothetical protein